MSGRRASSHQFTALLTLPVLAALLPALLTILAGLLVLLTRLLLTRLLLAWILLATALIVLIHANPPLSCTSPTGR
jgi:ABC-type branched-subunit amino acid transport system permease subunit